MYLTNPLFRDLNKYSYTEARERGSKDGGNNNPVSASSGQ